MFRIFRKKADKQSFELFDSILEALTSAKRHGSSYTVTYQVTSAVHTDAKDISSFDDETSFGEATDTTTTKINGKHIVPLKATQWNTLPEKLHALRQHLEENITEYSANDIINISQKTYDMVRTIDTCLNLPNEKNVSAAKQAKNDFLNAFKKNNIITAGLVGAVIGALAGLLAGPLGIIPGAIAGFKAGITGAFVGATSAILIKTLSNGNPRSTTYVNEVMQAVETLLPMDEIKNISSPNKYGVSDNNYSSRLRVTHEEVTDAINPINSDVVNDDFQPSRKSWFLSCCR